MISLFALLLLLITVLMVFGVRSLMHYKRTGDAGWRSPSRKVDRTQWWCRIIMGAASVALLMSPILALTGVLPTLVEATGLRWVGLGVAVVAALAILAAQTGLGASWRIGVSADERTTLVTAGWFALVRNPIFTAMLAFCLGQLPAVPNLAAMAGAVLAIASVQWQVRAVEEPYLQRVHGDAYREYASTVGRFLPGVGRLV